MARLVVRLRRPETLTASIVDVQGEHVRTLEAGVRRAAGATRFRWDGRDDEGNVVADGRYRLKLELAGDQTIVVPTPVRVDTKPPEVELVSARPRVISPDGDGRGDRVRYTYRSSEFGYPVVYVDGELTARGRHWSAGIGRAQWRALVRGGRSRPRGTYRTDVRVVDPAGNESAPGEAVTVRVRFVELVGVPRRVRPGAPLRFRVDADAKEVRLLVESRSGRDIVFVPGPVAPGSVTIRAPRVVGAFALIAIGPGGHRVAALVRVSRRG